MMLADPALQDTAGMRLSVLFNPERSEKLFAGSGHTFQELLAAADAGKALPHFALPGSVRATVRSERKELESQNVAGVLRGSDPALRNDYVVLSAHLDHVGVGKPINGDPIYNGAMDNASGVASLLDVAASLHDSNAKLKRSLLFLAVTAEEKGLLGSRYFATHPTVNAKSIVADVNLDMFLPIVPLRVLTVYGLNESDLGDSIRAAAAPLGIAVDGDPHPERNVFIRSDQYNFIREGVPSLSFKIGYKPGSPEQAVFEKWIHDRYHAPSDDLNQPVDLQAAAGFDSLMRRLAEAVANRPERPQWRANSFFRRFQHP
jgi:Zn-dependent M28 family amino/carboxypeptidase